MPRDSLALALGQAKYLPCASGCNMSMHKSVHPHHTLDAGIPAQVAAEAFVMPIVAEEIVQQCGAKYRSGFVPGQTHPAGDGISRLRYGNRMVINRIVGAVMLERAQLLKAWMLQNVPHELLDLAVQWTHPFRFVLSLLYVAGYTKTSTNLLHYCDILLERFKQPPGDTSVQQNRRGKSDGFGQREGKPDGGQAEPGQQHRRGQNDD